MKKYLALGFRLAVFVAAVVAMLAAVNYVTQDTIAERQRIQGEIARSSLMEGTFSPVSEVDFPEDLNSVTSVYRAEKDGLVTGYCFEVTAKGYNEITMIIGVNSDLTVAGIRILSQTETPGIGSKATDENGVFLPQFKGLTSRNLDTVVAVSGATLSSGGIRQGVADAVEACRLILEGKGE